MNHRKVLKFIRVIRNSFIGADYTYTHGSCYQFYLILKLVFPCAEAYYNSDHIITRIMGRYYDITGEVKKDGHLLVDEHYSHEKLKKLKAKVEYYDEAILRRVRKEQKVKPNQ